MLHVVASETVMGETFMREDFTGDLLFATSNDIQTIRDHIPAGLLRDQEPHIMNQNDRLPATIQITAFSFNMLQLKVTVTGPANEACFLYYADSYHPHWKASVNGMRTPVIKSNIGFKSIMIPYGESEVIFYFGNLFYTLSICCTMFLLSLLLCITIFLFITEMRKGEYDAA